ncbi:hypothetical protein ERO13_D11G106033v2 [Gossypium hirsutum]|uniref:Uncharacterized protein n=3 Tax=Gossypium TaxID=3633 RepID=A0A5D2SRF3_GOSMU|nr:hypothetical protein ERO13_D11G106033v2 [Gossypium hirsutum]TYG44711.1 hypothetical protein ES288_D11G117400v1 [Gossypium darwinii]TYH43255.1 hypothetical protein ES332_D11G115200v1 [Gossypium tomentosum]TYI55056.1 hypothetical protein E1A91_D11G114500v1 [Gossypium mustelinum]
MHFIFLKTLLQAAPPSLLLPSSSFYAISLKRWVWFSKGHGRQASAVGTKEEDFGTSYSPTVAHPQGYHLF